MGCPNMPLDVSYLEAEDSVQMVSRLLPRADSRDLDIRIDGTSRHTLDTFDQVRVTSSHFDKVSWGLGK